MNAFCSLSSQILKFIPHGEFEGRVRKLNAERHARGVSCWQQFVSMQFCQLGRAHSLREIEQGLKSCEGKLSHLGFEALSKSSLSYANAHRPWRLHEGVFYQLLQRFQGELEVGGGGKKKKKFKFKSKLINLDSSVIDLCLKICTTGRNSVPLRERSSCIWCSITTATCRVSVSSLLVRWRM